MAACPAGSHDSSSELWASIGTVALHGLMARKHGLMACCQRLVANRFCVVRAATCCLNSAICSFSSFTSSELDVTAAAVGEAVLLLIVMSRRARSTVDSSFLVSPVARNWLLTDSGNPAKNWCRSNCSRAFASSFGIAWSRSHFRSWRNNDSASPGCILHR